MLFFCYYLPLQQTIECSLMKNRFLSFFTILFLESLLSLYADIDITNLYLQNAGFDDAQHFDYTIRDNGNTSQEILPVYGWNKDIGVDYTVTGIYQIGTQRTFNTSGKVPSKGYDGSSNGGCLVLSTGWEESLKYYQTITLPAGSYKLQSVFYNGSNSTNGKSLMSWIPTNGNAVASSISSFPQNSWTNDNLSFTLSNETEGRIQIGFQGAPNGSANSAKVVVDYVKLILVGDNSSLINNLRNTLKTTISTANQLYGDGSGHAAEQLHTYINNAQQIYDNNASSYEDIFLINETLKDQITLYKWENSTIDNPSDLTHFIINPNFEDKFNGWKQSGLQTQSNTSFPKKSGNYYVEKWVSAGSTIGNVFVTQELSSDLPKGKFILKVNAQNTQNGKDGQKGAWIRAGNDSIEVSEAKEYTLQFTHIESLLSIGFITYDATGNWIALDNFRLYYAAATTDDYKAELLKRVTYANELLKETLDEQKRIVLQFTTQTAQGWINTPSTTDALSSIAMALRIATNEAQQSVKLRQQLGKTIQTAKDNYQENKNGSEALASAIRTAESNKEDEQLSDEEIRQSIKQLENAIFTFKVSNATGDSPSETTDPRCLRGATMAFGRATFSGKDIIEKGFCWSTQPEPTATDQRSTLFYNNNGDIYVMEGLAPSTIYYIRPYAITSNYAVGYGKILKICTLPMGNVTWTYNNGGSDEENDRINYAIADAVDIWNHITSINGLHLSVSYGASTPTADCSYGGSMRVGPNASYQRTGTIQHEMCHAAGVGTTDTWYNSSTYRQETSKGFWLGERTDQVVQFFENDGSAHLKGDDTHFWPYGINGAHEDDGTRILYYANALIIQALGEDNLPPIYGAFASPAYTFTQEDKDLYYLLPVNETIGNKAYMLKANNNGGLTLESYDWYSALSDNAIAWRIHFNPKTQLYDFENVATKQSITCTNSQVGQSTSNNYKIQLLGSRQNTVNTYFNLKTYWMTFADGSNKPKVLTNNNRNISSSTFDHRNSSTQQRWMIVTRDEIKALAGDYTQVQETNESSSLLIYGEEDQITFRTIQEGAWITLYNLFGQMMDHFYMQADLQLSKKYAKGIYIVNGQKIIVK